MPDIHAHPLVEGAYDRTPSNPAWDELVAREDKFAQGADLNEAQSLVTRRQTRLGNLVAKDGDVSEGCAIICDTTAGTIRLGAGKLYVRGDVRPVEERLISGVTFTGDLTVGVRLKRSVVTEAEYPDLLGRHPGTEGEGEPGSVRVVVTLEWALPAETITGDFYGVYLVRNGTVIDQKPPPNLSGVNAAIAVYDREANGNYIASGCRVTALGLNGDGAQEFAIEEGSANIFGFKRVRYTALRHSEPQVPDLATVDAEPHLFADGGTGTAIITLNQGPLQALNGVVIVRQKTETVLRGTPNNTSDNLSETSVTEIVSVVQGGTTFVAGTDYSLNADKVDWSAAGSEPSGGSSYDVTFRYLDQVPLPDVEVLDQDRISVSGGVTGTQVLVGYNWKMPRIDLLCLDSEGLTVYLKGQSTRTNPQPPIPPVTLLPLCEISNDWRATPIVTNNGVRAYHYTKIDRMYGALMDSLNLIGLERLRYDINIREPVAKQGVFVDPFTSNRFRDAGEMPLQTAAVGSGFCELMVDPTFFQVALPGNLPIMLDYVEEVVVSQPLVTGCLKINPYENFEPLIANMSITPSEDFWTETREEWLRTITRTVNGRQAQNATPGMTTNIVDEREELLEFLRQIPIAFEITGFTPGEELELLTFDGVDVTPDPVLAANGAGELSGTFTIPANVTAGTKRVSATGSILGRAEADFVGQGTLDITVLQRIRTMRETGGGIGGREGSGGGGGADPLAQTWMLQEHRHILGMDVKPCAFGDLANPILCELVDVETGLPTRFVRAVSQVELDDAVLHEWLPCRHPWPVFRPMNTETAHVFKTDSGVHALSIATVGEVDPQSEQFVSGQPYSVGVLLSSANARTWTPHQTADLTFRLIAAKFTANTKVVDLGSFDLVDCSDLVVRAAVELPTADCQFHFEVEWSSGEVNVLQPDQLIQFDTYRTDTVQLRAVLRGTEKVSPTLYPGILLISGKIRAQGVYISRLFAIGTSADFRTWLKTFLPSGQSQLTVHVDKGDDNWTMVPHNSAQAIDGGWVEREYKVDPYTSPEGRLKLTLTGGPASRPLLQDLRAASI